MMNDFNLHKQLLIWDSEESPPEFKGTILLWQSYLREESANTLSIPLIVEKNSDKLRFKYLEFISKLGNSKIKGRSIIEQFEIRPGFSYWWMTILAKKCNYTESPYITDIVKLIALYDIIKMDDIQEISLYTNNAKMVTSIKQYCQLKHIGYRKMSGSVSSSDFSNSSIVTINVFVGFISFLRLLKYFINRRSFKKDPKIQTSEYNDIAFIDYLFNLSSDSLKTGIFESHYWGRLIPTMKANRVKTNWLHIFLSHEAIPTVKRGNDVVNAFNEQNILENHANLDAFLTFKLYLNIFKDFFSIIIRSLSIRNVKENFNYSDKGYNFFHWFRKDWNDSLYGSTLVVSCIYINLFEAVLQSFPKQKLGIYLMENQSWEMPLIYYWKKFGHGELVGFAHTVIRYWDLRYFSIFDLNEDNALHALPIPDRIAVNGKIAHNNLIHAGFQGKRLINVEALRYLYLNELKSQKECMEKKHNETTRLLVLGDYLVENNKRMMDLLCKSLPYLNISLEIIVKPHPATDIATFDFPDIQFKKTNLHLSHLLNDFDIAYTSGTTASAADAFFAGLTVLSVLDGKTLNISPLRGLRGAGFVSSGFEIAETINNFKNKKDVSSDSLFYLDNDLPSWKKLIGIN